MPVTAIIFQKLNCILLLYSNVKVFLVKLTRPKPIAIAIARKGQECAVKKISDYDEDDLREVDILKQLEHKHVIEFRSYHIEQTNREPNMCSELY